MNVQKAMVCLVIAEKTYSCETRVYTASRNRRVTILSNIGVLTPGTIYRCLPLRQAEINRFNRYAVMQFADLI